MALWWQLPLLDIHPRANARGPLELLISGLGEVDARGTEGNESIKGALPLDHQVGIFGSPYFVRIVGQHKFIAIFKEVAALVWRDTKAKFNSSAVLQI